MTSVTTSTTTNGRRQHDAVFSALIGLASLATLLQGLWAGLFLEHDGQRDKAETWISVHGLGADAALLLAVAATVVGFLRLRARRDLWGGSAVLVVLLGLESLLGGLIGGGKDALTAVHVPLAMALMGLVVWLSITSSRRA